MRNTAFATTALLALLAAPTAHAATQEIAVALHEYTGGLHLAPEIIYADAGDTLRVTVTNTGAAPHNLVFCGDAPDATPDCQDVWGRSENLAANQTQTFDVRVPKGGTFQYYCDIGPHKQAGMSGTLEVQGSVEEPKDAPAPGAALVALAAAALALLLRRR